jgi:phage tail protein X
MTKLLLLDSSEVNRLLADLDSTRRFGGMNAMLGFIRTLDGDNQWRANPDLMILADDCGAYRQVFMRQAGEQGGCVPVLNKEEATKLLVSLFNDIIARDPSQAEIDWGISELENGSTFERIRRSIAHRTEATEAITSLFSQIIRRLPKQEELADLQNRLSIDLTLRQVRQLIANSDEVKGLLTSMGMNLLDRSFSDVELSAYQSRLSASTKLDLIQQEIANSDEALAKVKYLYVNVVGRLPRNDEIIQTQTRFANDYTLQLLKMDLASSQDAKRAIARLHKIVFNRLPTNNEVGSWQVRLQDDYILQYIRKFLASSDETIANINRIYRKLLNRAPLESELTMWISRLSTDASLSEVEREIKAKHFVRKQYRVQRGDNLTYIAKMFYGDGNPVLRERHSSHHYYYRSIYNINRRLLSNPDLILPGQLLTVPTTSTPLTYRVRRGDTLSYISKLYYGNPHDYVRILGANPILASSPNFLRPGQILVIPYN